MSCFALVFFNTGISQHLYFAFLKIRDKKRTGSFIVFPDAALWDSTQCQKTEETTQAGREAIFTSLLHRPCKGAAARFSPLPPFFNPSFISICILQSARQGLKRLLGRKWNVSPLPHPSRQQGRGGWQLSLVPMEEKGKGGGATPMGATSIMLPVKKGGEECGRAYFPYKHLHLWAHIVIVPIHWLPAR